MEIRINKVFSSVTGEILVSFTSSYGTAEGVWIGDFPKVECSYNVELQIVGDITRSVNAHNAHELCSRIEKKGNLTSILARVESIEDDACCILRIGSSILLAEISGISYLGKGAFIEMEVETIKLYDTKL